MSQQIKTVLITGGSRGMGKKIAQHFLENGYHIIIAARNKYELDFPEDRCLFVQTDVRDPASLDQAVAAAIKWKGQLNVLINNAGYSAWKPLAEIDEAFWDDMINTNLKGVLFGSKAAAAVMKAGDTIINISSLAGKRGSANNSVYCASKFGVNGITQALAKELGAKGIRVNAVCPVYIRTAGLEEALNKENSPSKGAELTGFLDDFAKSQTALGVLPTDEQVAATCFFLASTAAGAITGQCINVDCGVMPQ
jgi:3-oxoacyl-[acyl-carrier protein] reductase/meso-butanediol dehydrogenase/(S,S)-butanediol dehydrogenase/diacetyl reductase